MENTVVPNVNFKVRAKNAEGNFEWTYPTTADYFQGKRVVVFSLPGAFTPTCTNNQVPAFNAMYNEFIALGIDEVYCVSVNDTFVMNAWAKSISADKIKLIPDGSAEFTEGMGMLVAKDNLGFGKRSWRYAMVVNDGVVEKFFEEPGRSDNVEEDPYDETAPEHILGYLTEKVANIG
jgi:peroxiredoxin